MMKPVKLQQLRTFLFLIALTAISFSCGNNQGDIDNIAPDEYPAKSQTAIGKAILSEILSNKSQFPVLSDQQFPLAYRFIRDSIFKTILNTPNVERRSDLEWQVYLLDDDDVSNAFMLPGGYLFIYTGLLKFLDGNYQLMALMAHEVKYADSDIIMDKLVRRFGKSTMGAILLGKEVPEMPQIADFFKTVEFGKSEVLTADAFAIELMCPFNYDARGIKSILEKADSEQVYVEWIKRKDCEPVERITQLDTIYNGNAECAEGEGLFLEDAYKRFIQFYLP